METYFEIKLMTSTFFEKANVNQQLSEFVAKTDHLSMGDYTKKFEYEFARFHVRKHCVMVNSGSSANLVLLQALKNLGRLKAGSKIGVSAVTWSTNVMPLIQLGFEPVLIDVAFGDVNMGVNELKQKIDSLAAVFVTNILGLNNQIELIKDLCIGKEIILLEDNCEALGCEISAGLLGNFSLASTNSSFVGHHLSTIEGGYIFTDDDELCAMCKVVRAHGWTRNLSESERELLKVPTVDSFLEKYLFVDLGFNVRPTDISAYCGILQLPLLNHYNSIRRDRYRIAKKSMPEAIYGTLPGTAAFAIPLRCKSRIHKRDVIKFLNEQRIENRPLVSGSMGKQPFWKNRYEECVLPNAEEIDDLALYVSNDPQINVEDFETLIQKLRQVM